MHIECRFFGVETTSEIFHQYIAHIAMQISGSGMRGEGMIISNEEKATMLVLHLDEVLKGTKIVAQMKVSGGTYATNYSFHNERLNILQSYAFWKKWEGIF